MARCQRVFCIRLASRQHLQRKKELFTRSDGRVNVFCAKNQGRYVQRR